MESRDYELACSVFSDICDLDAAERQQQLAEQCGDDESLRQRVLSMLQADDRIDPIDDEKPVEKIGEYHIAGLIGRGGMGTVYRAEHSQFNRTVAIKIFRHGSLPNRSAERRFQREVEAAALLIHPNVVRAFDAGIEGKQRYLVMEFVDGADFSRIIANGGPLTVEQAIAVLRQVCEGMCSAAEKQLLHRDLKPANLILSRDGVVKILDLGLAKFGGAEEVVGEPRLTLDSQIMGTVDYMSPEQAEDAGKIDQRSDIYSLGCTLYCLLTGSPPYTQDTVMKTLWAHREAPVPSLRQHCASVSKNVDQLFQKMVAKQPGKRFASFETLKKALDELRGDTPNESVELKSLVDRPLHSHSEVPTIIGDRSTREWHRTSTTAKKGRRWLLAIVPIVALAAAIGAAAWKATSDQSASKELVNDTTKPTPEVTTPAKPTPPLAAAPFDEAQALAHQQEWARWLGSDVDVENSIGIKFRLIPAGSFLMGSTEDRVKQLLVDARAREPMLWDRHIGAIGRPANFLGFHREVPQHSVTVTSPYYLGICEVTQQQYAAVMSHNPSFHSTTAGYTKIDDTTHFPVEQVSWNHAQDFCERLSALPNETAAGRSYRLPTEAEWEFACRAGTITWLCVGDEMKSFSQMFTLNHNKCKYRPVNVASFAPNAFGLFDMHGNVAEWCEDRFGSYSEEQSINPTGPNFGNERVTRGGTWSFILEDCRSAHRNPRPTDYVNANVGMRLVMERQHR